MGQTNNDFARRRFDVAIMLLLIVGTLAVYFPALQSDFVAWDDGTLIYQNPHLTGWSLASLKWMFSANGYVLRYQPLTWMTWFTIHDLFGLRPFGYHLINVLFHCANSVLVYLLTRKLLLLSAADCSPEKQRDLAICGGLGALLWALHPLRVEAVAWASALLHSQSLFFLLLAVLLYLKANSSNARPRLFLIGSVGCFAGSLFSYPIGVGFVVVLVVLDFCPLRRFTSASALWDKSARAIWLEKVPFLILIGVAVAGNVMMRFGPTPSWATQGSTGDFTLLHRMMQAFYVWTYYLWRPWMPFHLASCYPQLYSFDPFATVFLASLVLIVGMTVLLLVKRVQWPILLALWVSHLAMLVPVLGLTEHPHFTSDRYSLTANITWSVLLGGLVLRQRQDRRRFALVCCGSAVVVACLGLLSFQQAGIWRNSIALYEQTIKVLGEHPLRAQMWVNLGLEHARSKHPDEAVECYRRAKDAQPEYPSPYRNAATLLLKLGRSSEAIEWTSEAVRRFPKNPELLQLHGMALFANGKLDAALEQLEKTRAMTPNEPSAYENLAFVLDRVGKTNEATQARAEAGLLRSKQRH